MDARLDARGFLDGHGASSYVLRNAGARATEDVVRSLAVACLKGVRRVLVIHHTHCAMAALTQEELERRLGRGPGGAIDFRTIADPDEALRADVKWLREHPLLPRDLEIIGYSFDLDTATSRLVQD
jgi:carbonic anhydrase